MPKNINKDCFLELRFGGNRFLFNFLNVPTIYTECTLLYN